MRFIFVLLALMFLMVVAIPAAIFIVVATIAVAKTLLPWLLITFGIWLLVRGGRSPSRQRSSRPHWQSHHSQGRRASPPDPARSHQPPAQVLSARSSDLPIEVEVKVEQIRRKVDVLLGYAARFPVFSRDLYLVRQTASEYLPRTIDAYRALAAAGGAQTMHASGKTAEQELHEQLDLLDLKLDEIARDLQRRDLDHLLTNRRFLEERFGHRIA